MEVSSGLPRNAGGWENTKRVKKIRFTCSTRHVVRVPLVGKNTFPKKVWSIDFVFEFTCQERKQTSSKPPWYRGYVSSRQGKRSLAKECPVKVVVCFVGKPRSWSLGRHSHQRADAAGSPHFEGRTQPQCLAFLLLGS